MGGGQKISRRKWNKFQWKLWLEVVDRISYWVEEEEVGVNTSVESFWSLSLWESRGRERRSLWLRSSCHPIQDFWLDEKRMPVGELCSGRTFTVCYSPIWKSFTGRLGGIRGNISNCNLTIYFPPYLENNLFFYLTIFLSSSSTFLLLLTNYNYAPMWIVTMYSNHLSLTETLIRYHLVGHITKASN